MHPVPTWRKHICSFHPMVIGCIFQLSFSVQVIDDIEENIVVMEVNTLMERTTAHLKPSVYQSHDPSEQQLKSYIERACEDLACNIDLIEPDYGLIR